MTCVPLILENTEQEGLNTSVNVLSCNKDVAFHVEILKSTVMSGKHGI